MFIPPVLLKDGYKVGHKFQYPDDTTMIYSNMTPRKSRVAEVETVVSFSWQYLVFEYLIRQFNTNFFNMPLDNIMKYYKRRINNYLGPDAITFDHIADLHKLGYLPLRIKAIPEGMSVPMRVPLMTIRNTDPHFYWLTNMLETLISCVCWGGITSATTALQYRKSFEKWAKATGAPKEFVPWQGHDFSFRGMFGVEAAMLSGAAHLLSFTGTDTIPGIDFLETYYGANSDAELVGGSVAATEHSVMSMGSKDGELETIRRLITQVYPKGIVSIVCDTWDFWKVLTEYLPELKAEIMARDGKVVVRPDSGDPVKVIVGEHNRGVEQLTAREWAIDQGAIATLWHYFGGQVVKGYKQLDPHVGLIYGDSITPERQEAILGGLAEYKFASSNVVLGIGSYTYQFVTRDTYGLAMKATYGETLRGPQNIYKDPITDDGTKKSATGLLSVQSVAGKVICSERESWDNEDRGLLQDIFINGKPHNVTTLKEMRARIESQL
jgi:nicotinamide phosphoribosyltransferase